MYIRYACLILVLIALYGHTRAETSPVTIRGRYPLEIDKFLKFAQRVVGTKTDNLVTLATEPSTTYEADSAALLSGQIDFAISPRPFPNGPNGVEVLHYPIATGAFTLVANINNNHQTKLTAVQVAKIFKGDFSAWNDASLITDNPSMKEATEAIELVVVADDEYTTTELRRYMESNSEGVWSSSTTFPDTVTRKSSHREALEYVKGKKGAITYVPFTQKRSGDLEPISLFIPQSADYVSPVLTHFANALMPLKRPEHLPDAAATADWAQFTLTDMRKMPPDGSCMSMPPYPLSHFVYLIIRRDQTTSPALHGAALAAFARIFLTPDVQQTAGSTGILTSTPPASQIASVNGLQRISFRSGESLDTYLSGSPIQESVPADNMPPGMQPGSKGMDNMEPASSSAVIAMIAFLLLSGVVCVVIYVIVLKVRYGGSFYDHATWVPWNIQKNAAHKMHV